MEDLRKIRKNKNKNSFSIIKLILNLSRYVMSKFKFLLILLSIFVAVCILFKPKESAIVISNWYNNFVGTIIEQTNIND